jgi:hypothetical protein
MSTTIIPSTEVELADPVSRITENVASRSPKM